MYRAKVIANYFIKKSKLQNSPITHLKLQKLVYIAHGWYLALTSNSLIVEPIERYEHGLIISSIFEEFISYGNSPIEDFAKVSIDSSIICDDYLIRFLNRVWDVFGNYSAVELAAMCHYSDSPYYISKDRFVNNHQIREYFIKVAKE